MKASTIVRNPALRSPGAGGVRPQDLELRHLVALRAVATEGSFGRAAARLGYTQSAVSQQIAALERVVGGRLFDRPGGPRSVELTPLGRVLLDHTDGLLEKLTSMALDVQRFRSGVGGRIDIGTIQSVSTALLPAMLSRLREERPTVEARLVEYYEDTDLRDALLAGALDVTFLVHATDPDIDVIDLMRDPFLVVARASDVDSGPVSAATLNARPLIGQQDGTCQSMVDDGLRAAGCEPDYVFRSSDNGAVIAMVRSGIGLAVLPRLALIEQLDDPMLAIRPMEPPIPDRVIRLAWRRDRTLSPAAAHFITVAREMSAEMAGTAYAS